MLNRTIFFFVAVVLAIIVGFAGALVARDGITSIGFALLSLGGLAAFLAWAVSDDGREHYRELAPLPPGLIRLTPENVLGYSEYQKLLQPSEHSPLPNSHPDKLHIVEYGGIRCAARRSTMISRLAAAGIYVVPDGELAGIISGTTLAVTARLPVSSAAVQSLIAAARSHQPDIQVGLGSLGTDDTHDV